MNSAQAVLACGRKRLHSAGVLKPDIGSLQADDAHAWGFAFHWLWAVAWSAAERRLGNSFPHELEDVAITAIGTAAEKVGEVASFDELQALTAVISDRRALDCIRRMKAERREAGATESIEGKEHLASAEPGPLEEVDARDLAKLLTELAAKLQTIDRQLLLACYFDGQKQAELAKRFGIPLGTVGVKLSRALKALRNELNKHPDLLKEMLEALR